MKAGPLCERVCFQERKSTRDALGGEIFTWTDRGEVWASVQPITGREAFIAQQVEAVTSLQVVTRRRDDVLPTWRIKWKNRTLSIEAALPSEERDHTTFLCSEGLNQADL